MDLCQFVVRNRKVKSITVMLKSLAGTVLLIVPSWILCFEDNMYCSGTLNKYVTHWCEMAGIIMRVNNKLRL